MATWSYRIKSWPGLARASRFSSSQMAYLCGVSLRQLQRHFHDIYNLKLHQWLMEVRLNDARDLLEEGKSVKEVAYLLNFHTSNHFSREFKRHFGVTPGHYSDSKVVPLDFQSNESPTKKTLSAIMQSLVGLFWMLGYSLSAQEFPRDAYGRGLQSQKQVKQLAKDYQQSRWDMKGICWDDCWHPSSNFGHNSTVFE